MWAGPDCPGPGATLNRHCTTLFKQISVYQSLCLVSGNEKLQEQDFSADMVEIITSPPSTSTRAVCQLSGTSLNQQNNKQVSYTVCI